jgi:putative salt-induced outer membrane protein
MPLQNMEKRMRRTKSLMLLIVLLPALPVIAQEGEGGAEEEPLWVGSLGLSWVATSGNTDTSAFGLDFGLDRKPEPWGLSLAARGNRADDNGVLTAENYVVAARAVRKLGERWEGFGGLQWSKDPFAGYDSQTVVSAGATYIAVNSDRHYLNFDAGLAYTWEDRIPPGIDTDFAGGILGLAWEWKLSESAKLTERLMFYPNFDASSDWRLTSVTAIEAAVHEWLALRFGYDVRHRNEPIGDAKSTDTTSTASVVFNF